MRHFNGMAWFAVALLIMPLFTGAKKPVNTYFTARFAFAGPLPAWGL
jgi:hypothetical protein